MTSHFSVDFQLHLRDSASVWFPAKEVFYVTVFIYRSCTGEFIVGRKLVIILIISQENSQKKQRQQWTRCLLYRNNNSKNNTFLRPTLKEINCSTETTSSVLTSQTEQKTVRHWIMKCLINRPHHNLPKPKVMPSFIFWLIVKKFKIHWRLTVSNYNYQQNLDKQNQTITVSLSASCLGKNQSDASDQYRHWYRLYEVDQVLAGTDPHLVQLMYSTLLMLI